MARRPDGRQARTQRLIVRLTPDGMAAVDQRRGALTRSDYIRALLAKDAKK